LEAIADGFCESEPELVVPRLTQVSQNRSSVNV
jgi:hypothetical protein